MVRLGIVGCGTVTERHHLPALKWVRDIKVVALADEDRSRLQQLGKEHRVEECYTSYGELIASGNVDAVAVCLPPSLHPEVALAALTHRKHVFIEKPLALNLADCDRLITANDRDPSRKVMVGFNLRWHRLVRQARDIISRNELGPIRLVRTIFASGKQHNASAWRNSRDTGGGLIFDLGVHHFDAVRFLLQSEVEAVRSSTTSSDKIATVIFSMTNGAQVVCSFAEETGQNQAFEIYGDGGWLRISCYRSDGLERFSLNQHRGRLRSAANSLVTLPRTLSQSRRGGEFAASYIAEWNHFTKAILLDKPVEADLLAGRRAVEIALAALQER
jgi:predicted dehydrogenase